MKDQEIKEALESLLNEIVPLTEDKCEEEIRTWLAAATLRIWAGNKQLAEGYVEALSILKGRQYTPAQVLTAMECAGESSCKVKAPLFFYDLAMSDRKPNKSRAIADSIGRFLALMAMVNGDFTIEEATALRQISNSLLECCERYDVPEGIEREIHPEMITPLSPTGYFMPMEDTKAAQQPEKPEKPEKSEQPVVQRPAVSERNDASSKGDGEEKDSKLNLWLVPDADGGWKLVSDEDSAEPEKKERKVTQNSPQKAERPAAAAKKEETLESVLAELNGLVGLDKVKNDVQSLLNFIRICQMRTQRGMKVPTVSYHLVFTGNPGTGKTTVARMVAKLYYLMGILPQGQLVETDRSGLVAGYLGQTAIKTQKVIQEALGGVLFIDEAYSLANDDEDSYGKEAIETLLKAMEDHRDELVVIVAGYDELMHKFIDSNPGLRSRFNKYFNFPDYDGQDLLLIFNRFCETNGYTLAQQAVAHLQAKLNDLYENREEHFGNARAVRNLFEHAINHQANRLVQDPDITDRELAELTVEDIALAMEEM